MKKLLLTSNGIFLLTEQDRGELFALVGKRPSEIRLALIPTAGYPYIKQEYVEAAIKDFGDLGMKVEIVDLKEENEQTLDRKLSSAHVIYVNGGSSYWLLHWVRESGFDTVIRRLLDQGKVYVGVSAGSIVAGLEVSDLTDSENVTGMKDTCGMRLVEFAVWPHYTADDPRNLTPKARGLGYPVVALTDQQAVVVNGDECRIIGPGPRVTFSGFSDL